MKKLIIASLLILGANMASAQGTKAPGKSITEQSATNETDRMTRTLGLNEQQKVKIQDINVRSAKELDNLRAAGPNASQERAKAITQNRDAQYKTVLTADQYMKYEEMTGKIRK